MTTENIATIEMNHLLGLKHFMFSSQSTRDVRLKAIVAEFCDLCQRQDGLTSEAQPNSTPLQNVDTNKSETIAIKKTKLSKGYLHYYLGTAYNCFSVYNGQAEEHLSKAIKLSTQSSSASELAALAYNELGEVFWKKAMCKEEILLPNTNIEEQRNKQSTCFREAKKCFELAVTKNPKLTYAFINLSMIKRRFGNTDQEFKENAIESINIAKKAIQTDMTNPDSWNALGNAYMAFPATEYTTKEKNLTLMQAAFAKAETLYETKVKQITKAITYEKPTTLKSIQELFRTTSLHSGETATTEENVDASVASILPLNNPDLHFTRAQGRMFQGDIIGALQDYQIASRIDSSLGAQLHVTTIRSLLKQSVALIENQAGVKSKSLKQYTAELGSSFANGQSIPVHGKGKKRWLQKKNRRKLCKKNSSDGTKQNASTLNTFFKSAANAEDTDVANSENSHNVEKEDSLKIKILQSLGSGTPEVAKFGYCQYFIAMDAEQTFFLLLIRGFSEEGATAITTKDTFELTKAKFSTIDLCTLNSVREGLEGGATNLTLAQPTLKEMKFVQVDSCKDISRNGKYMEKYFREIIFKNTTLL